MVEFSNIVVLAVAALVALVMFSPDRSDPTLKSPIKVIKSDDEVERFLRKYKSTIGDDYEGYRGHIYRVMTYAMHFLGNDDTYKSVVGIALVYHDIGLWTENSLSYIEPSCKKAKEEMKKAKYSPRDVNLVQDIIYWHHKVTEFESDTTTDATPLAASTTQTNDRIINAVRKADMIDFSFGLVSYGMPKEHIKLVMSTIPENNFHKTLLYFGPKLYGYNIAKIVTELASIFRF